MTTTLAPEPGQKRAWPDDAITQAVPEQITFDHTTALLDMVQSHTLPAIVAAGGPATVERFLQLRTGGRRRMAIVADAVGNSAAAKAGSRI